MEWGNVPIMCIYPFLQHFAKIYFPSKNVNLEYKNDEHLSGEAWKSSVILNALFDWFFFILQTSQANENTALNSFCKVR